MFRETGKPYKGGPDLGSENLLPIHKTLPKGGNHQRGPFSRPTKVNSDKGGKLPEEKSRNIISKECSDLNENSRGRSGRALQ